MVSIEERFLIKSRLWWRTYGTLSLDSNDSGSENLGGKLNPMYLTKHKDGFFPKNLLENKEMVFKKWVKNKQTAGYNGARTVL